MKPTGGSAFPALLELQGKHSSEADLLAVSSGGMTLRDYFAAKSIDVAWKAEEQAPTYFGAGLESPTYRGIAVRAYLLADAMLAEREK